MSLSLRGFHGTTLEAAQSILATGFRQSDEPWDWLGTGVYFWQDAPLRAYQWSVEWSRIKGRSGVPVVVQADVNLDGCLDLLDIFWDGPIKKASADFLQLLTTLDKKDLKNKPGGRNLMDCAFFNFLAESLQEKGVPVRSIRAAVTEGQALFPESPIHDRSHIQVAVRDLGMIGTPRIIFMEEDLVNVARGFYEY